LDLTVAGGSDHQSLAGGFMKICKALVGLTVVAAIFAGARLSAADQALYRVTVKTSEIGDAGTDAIVRIRLNGTNGSSPFMYLDDDHDNFERGDSDLFDLWLPDVGVITSIDLEFTGYGGMYAGWCLDFISVAGPSGTAYLPFYNWFIYDGTYTLSARPL
jgi:hypothetical protein